MAYIVGTGSYLPGVPVTNEMLAEIFGEPIKLIGDYFEVMSRYFAVDYQTGENTNAEFNSDFCCKAINEALQKTPIKKEEIGLLITGTNTPDYSLPQTSALIQEKIGLKNIIPLDLRGGCSVTLQAILIAENFIKNGLVKNAIVVGGECFSTIYYSNLLKNKGNYLVKDLMNSLIFGDGAGAIIISKERINNNAFEIDQIVSRSSFAQWPPGFIVSWGGSKVNQSRYEEISSGKMMNLFPKEIDAHMVQANEAIYKSVLADKGYNICDFKFIVGPQANKRLMDSLNKSFKIKNSFYNGDVTGNVPGGALLIALNQLIKEAKFEKSDRVLVWGLESAKWIYGYCILNKV